MALRDSFGFPAAPRPGLEAATQQERSRPESAVWGKVRCPEVSDAATHELAQKRLASLKETLRSDGPASHAERRSLWVLASGALAKKASNGPVSYTQWAQKAASLKTEVVVMVDTDIRSVGLTFRPHPLYRSAAGVAAMSNVLIALLASNPNLGYTRQLAHLVAFTMVVFGGAEHEEMVFWTLKGFLEDRLFSYCGGEWLYGIKVEQEVLTRLAQRKFPRLVAHLASLRLSVASFTQPWLSGLYVSHLPPETVARVWDATMCEGPKVLLRTGLALLKMYEQTLVSCSFPEVLRKVLDLRVSRTTDAAGLLNTAFKGCGSLPGVQVDTLRQDAMRVLRDAGEGGRRPPSPSTASPPAGGGTSNGGASGGGSGARSFFGVGSVSFRSRASGGTSSAGSSPPTGPPSVLNPPASPTPSDGGAAAAVLAPPPPPPVATAAVLPQSRGARQVGSQLSSMLSRLVGSVKESAVVTGAGMGRSVTSGNVPELAAC